MSAFRYEYELAKKDGVNFLWQTQPVRISARRSRDRARMRAHATRRARHARQTTPETIPNSEFTIEVDMVVRAVGQKPVTEFLRAVKGIELRKDGTIVVNGGIKPGIRNILPAAIA